MGQVSKNNKKITAKKQPEALNVKIFSHQALLEQPDNYCTILLQWFVISNNSCIIVNTDETVKLLFVNGITKLENWKNRGIE